jgi:hypothetical protein
MGMQLAGALEGVDVAAALQKIATRQCRRLGEIIRSLVRVASDRVAWSRAAWRAACVCVARLGLGSNTVPQSRPACFRARYVELLDPLSGAGAYSTHDANREARRRAGQDRSV